jgi:hypothetical protein
MSWFSVLLRVGFGFYWMTSLYFIPYYMMLDRCWNRSPHGVMIVR